MAIEPKFTYPNKTLKAGSPESAAMVAQDKVPEKKKKRKRKKRNRHTGASLGWGWFQGFNLFITLYFLIGFLIFGYFMMGGESRHEGLPKYVLDRADQESGKVVFNPQIPDAQRKKFIYVPPVKVPTVNDQELEALANQQPIQLIGVDESSEAQRGSSGIELISMDDNESVTEVEYKSEELIEMAQMAKSMGNYVGTNQQDAYYFYQQVLTMDPNNDVARNGVSEIAYIYYQNADRAIFEGDYQKADQYIKVGLIVEPNNQSLKDLREELNFFMQGINQGVQQGYNTDYNQRY